jgi:hypothetical protein
MIVRYYLLRQNILPFKVRRLHAACNFVTSKVSRYLCNIFICLCYLVVFRARTKLPVPSSNNSLATTVRSKAKYEYVLFYILYSTFYTANYYIKKNSIAFEALPLYITSRYHVKHLRSCASFIFMFFIVERWKHYNRMVSNKTTCVRNFVNIAQMFRSWKGGDSDTGRQHSSIERDPLSVRLAHS